jgi:hypothetical protein
MLSISREAEDLIIDEEVSSKAYYERHYRRPEWPGGASGVTIGIGYDLGYSSAATIAEDWSPVVQASMVTAMQAVAGLHGERAHNALNRVKYAIEVSYDEAMHVFDDTDKPRWIRITNNALPNCDKLHPHCLGALVSLAYNRGASFSSGGDRCREMRAIRLHMANEEFFRIPTEFRSMKRLWRNGLVGRREREARLFERGLSIMKNGSTADAPKIMTRSEQIKRTTAQSGAAVGAAGGTGTAAGPKPSFVHGHELLFVVGVVVLCSALGAAVVHYANLHFRLPKADPPDVPAAS